jgi:serine/threonine protein kinase/tetratricopeptide (TPR) repeat protein
MSPPQGAPPGAELLHYVLLHPLGAGGMGVVYCAYDTRLERRVALKFVGALRVSAVELPPTIANPSRKTEAETCDGDKGMGLRIRGHFSQLMREARAVAQVRHPHVVPIYDVFAHKGVLYLAMALVEGKTLRETYREREEGTVGENLRTRLRWLSQCAQALASIHRAGLSHGDFKPENVMIDRRHGAMVLDFGLSHRIESSQGKRAGDFATQDINPAGTPPYSAPEILAGEPIGAQSDVFSWGVVLYETVCRVRPFAGVTFAEVRQSQSRPMWQEHPRFRAQPPWLRELIASALHVDAQQRLSDLDRASEVLIARSQESSHRFAYASMFVMASALAGAATSMFAEPSSALVNCDNSNQVVDPWHFRQREAVHQRFIAMDHALGEVSFARIDDRLAPWFEAWSAARRSLCEGANAIELHGAKAVLLDRQVTCLQRQEANVVALVDGLRVIDKPGLEKAISSAEQIGNVDDCLQGDLDASFARWPLPDSALAEADEARALLDKAEIWLNLGNQDRALAFMAKADAIDHKLQWLPLHARCLSAKTRLAQVAWHQRETLDSGLRAFLAHLAIGDGEHAFESMHGAIVAAGYTEIGVEEEGEMDARLHALAGREVDHPLMRARAYVASGASATHSGDLLRAEHRYSLGIAAFEPFGRAQEIARASALAARGSARAMMGDLEGGELDARLALRLNQNAYGDEHPALAHSLFTMALILNAQLRPREALHYIERGLQILHYESVGATPRAIPFLDYRVAAWRELGQWPQVVDEMPILIRAAESAFGRLSHRTLLMRLERARAMLHIGQANEAFAEILAVEAAPEARIAMVADVLVTLLPQARVQAKASEPSQVLRSVEQSIESSVDSNLSMRLHLVAMAAALADGDRVALRRHLRSIESCEKAVLDEEFMQGHLIVADAYLQLGDTERCSSSLDSVRREALRRDAILELPIRYHATLVRMLVAEGRAGAAREYAEEIARRFKPESAAPHEWKTFSETLIWLRSLG